MADPPLDVDVPLNDTLAPFPTRNGNWTSADYFCFNLGTGEDPKFTVPIPNSKITIPDVIVVISCAILAIFLLVTLPNAIRRFKESRSASIKIFLAYYVILWLALLMRISRSFFWWFKFRRDVDADEQSAMNVPWILLRGTIWMAELSVLIFLMHRNTRKYVIARVLAITLTLGIFYMGAMAVGLFALNLPLIGYTKPSGLFWAIHEFVFSIIYGTLFVLWCSPTCRKNLPSRAGFWVYAVALFLFHGGAGAGYLLRAIEAGALSYCVVSVTNGLYLASFCWLIYFGFLFRFLHTSAEAKTRLQVYYDDDYDDSAEAYSSMASEYQLLDDDLMDSHNSGYTPAYARAWAIRKGSVQDGDSLDSSQGSPSGSETM